MSYLDEKGFSASLKEAPEHRADNIIEPYVEGLSEDEATEKGRLLKIALQVMRAKTTKGLRRISVEDLIKSAYFHDEVCEILGKATAGREFRVMQHALIKVKSRKRRRIL